MSKCHGCKEPLQILDGIRTYHSQCDPQGRVEMLERVLAPFVAYLEKREAQPLKGLSDIIHRIHMGSPHEAEITMKHLRAARAALDYRPAQMKGREG